MEPKGGGEFGRELGTEGKRRVRRLSVMWGGYGFVAGGVDLGTAKRGRGGGVARNGRRWVAPVASAKNGIQFGSYSRVAEAGLVSEELLDGVAPPKYVVEVQAETPLGLVLAELSGGVYVAAVKPGGNIDKLGEKVRVGDRVIGTSSTFGNGTWPSLSLERVITALKTRYGGEVTLVLERCGLAEEIYDGIDAAAADRAIGAGVKVDPDEKEAEEQVRNALKSFVGLRSAGLPAIQTLTVLLTRSAELLKKYSRTGCHVASVRSLYQRLVKAAVPLDNKISNLVMSAFIGAGCAESAVEVFQNIPSPNTECYTTLMKAHSKRGHLKKLEETKEAMERNGVRLSEITYNTMMSAYALRGKVDRVEALFKEISVRNLVPDVFSWNIRMNAHSKRSSGTARRDRLMQLRLEMQQKRVAPNKVTYTILLGACVGCGDLRRAEALVEEMAENNVRPDTFTFNKLIEGYGDRLRYENALQLLATMEDEEDLQPDKLSYGLTVRACCAAGQPEIAKSVLQRMRARMLHPDAQVFAGILRAYAKVGDTTNAFRIVKEMQFEHFEPDVRIMSVLMHACVEAGDGALALSVYSKMVQLRMPTDVVTHTTLIRAYGKRGDTKMALRAFTAMKKDKVEPNVTTYNALLEMAMGQKKPKLALQVFEEMCGQKGKSLNSKSFQLLCDPKAFDDNSADYLEFLLDLLKSIQNNGKYGTALLYCELLRVCYLQSDAVTAETVREQQTSGLFKFTNKDTQMVKDAEQKLLLLTRRATSRKVANQAKVR